MHFLHSFAELNRLKFIMERDGLEKTIEFAKMTRNSYKAGMKLSKKHQKRNNGAFSHLSIRDSFKTPAIYSYCTCKLFVELYDHESV